MSPQVQPTTASYKEACARPDVVPRPVVERTAAVLRSGKVLYRNALIYTQDADGPWAQALVTDGEDIVFVGSAGDAERFLDESTRRIDLGGAFVMPGLIDTHTHPGLVGALQLEEGVDQETQTLPTGSKEELYSFLQRYADDHFWQPFVMLGAWDVHQFLPDGPRKEDLPGRPRLNPPPTVALG